MKIVTFIPVILSLVVLGAHFLRSGTMLGVAAMIALVALLPLRRPWVARLVQGVLVLGALEWLRTLVTLAIRRSEHGAPYLRMALILGVVAAISLAAALLFEGATLRGVYRRRPTP